MTGATLFSGGGGSDLGMKAAGLEVAWGIELDPAIAEVANANLGGHVQVGDILEADPRKFERVDVLHASPPCPNFSVAKAGGKESDLDRALASKVCEFIQTLTPDVFTLENVWAYRDSQSWAQIQETLFSLGYFVNVHHVNFADMSVPQSRRRMIVRAVRGGFVPHLPEPERHVGWYEAIADLVPTLPESKFADWQLKRLEASAEKDMELEPNFFVGGANKSQSFLDFAIEHRASIPGIRNGSQPFATIPADAATNAVGRAFVVAGMANKNGEEVTVRHAAEPFMTVMSSHSKHAQRAFLMADGNSSSAVIRDVGEPCYTLRANRHEPGTAWLEQGRVVSMTPRCLARFQTFPDSYELPKSKTLAAKIIGNAVPPLGYQKILEGLL